ncbi:MAG: alkaline phosphatase D family protein [Armatimonadetes bacterium]|nr:alkaline phosphatase D family protein [Armatimonadota bacterium]
MSADVSKSCEERFSSGARKRLAARASGNRRTGSRRTAVALALLVLAGLAASSALAEATWSDGTPIRRFDKRQDCSLTQVAKWQGLPQRHWAGPALWLNRLQDWTVRDGALECAPANRLPCRTAHLLTYELVDRPEPFRLEVIITLGSRSVQAGWAGFIVGAGQGRLDYRGAALVQGLPGKGGGLLAVVETSGEGGLAFRDMSQPETSLDYPLLPGQVSRAKEPIRLDYHRMMLELEGVPRPGGTYDLRLSVWAHHAGDLLGAQELRGVPAARLLGNVGLVSHAAAAGVAHRFEDFKVGGGRLVAHPEHAFGPIAGTLYSLSGRTLKMGVQFVHLGDATGPKGRRLAARLEARPAGSKEEYETLDGPKALILPAYYVPFRVEGWDSSRDWDTRVVFEDADGSTYTYATRVARDPVDKPVVSVAAFTGMGAVGRTARTRGPKPGPGQVVVGRWTPANVWAPFEKAVRAVAGQKVDLLFFTGDQIYEGKPTWPDPGRAPCEDYLYKWLIWHTAFRELTNHLPAICQTDDHDVYHGNLWGWGGRLDLTNRVNDGGYRCAPYFVNTVHLTQAGHNPDPYDPTPCLNGITNYYCGFTYGGVGFAVLEDRKFKTPPAVQDPAQQVLLGRKQLEFLRRWGEDWTGQKFKVVVSQTIYASMHVGFNGAIAKDTDTNGFPKIGRDRAVRLFRRCGALVISGDQHLGSFARLGVDAPSDAVYQFCVPALANIFWRWFYPAEPGRDRKPGEPDYLGEFTDPFGNFFRMIAVDNPERRELLGQRLRQRYLISEEEVRQGKGDEQRTCQGDGYGVVRFDKQRQMIRIECWPHDAKPGGKQFDGWPITLRLEDLDGRKPTGWLPDLHIEPIPDAVVQTINERTGEIVKITRVRRGFYRPGVFDNSATYTLRVSEPA